MTPKMPILPKHVTRIRRQRKPTALVRPPVALARFLLRSTAIFQYPPEVLSSPLRSRISHFKAKEAGSALFSSKLASLRPRGGSKYPLKHHGSSQSYIHRDESLMRNSRASPLGHSMSASTPEIIFRLSPARPVKSSPMTFRPSLVLCPIRTNGKAVP